MGIMEKGAYAESRYNNNINNNNNNSNNNNNIDNIRNKNKWLPYDYNVMLFI